MKGDIAVPRKSNKRSDWEIEDDMRTLIRAEEIMDDPKRFKEAKAMAKKKMDDMKTVIQKK